ncbi:MAG: DNA photolyase family protein, partial [Anaerolineaceae bacterium]|nr:DNA photolyase family protein [Anaerolineaceae bacterium]
GEKEAQSRLEDFIQNKASEYHTNRDRMDIDGTSSLSPYIHMGTISVCRILLSLEKMKSDISENGDLLGIETWKNELVWREFYQSILYHFPFVQKISFNPKFRSIEWSNSPEALIAWKDRSTGFPIVDAAMNQLLKSAWMHNRARMIVASFLTKDLLINWQEGEKWFMDQLIDGDLASNNGGWQWTAGVGTDAAPFFRIFNPILQSKKFDPQGDYIRKWVPALTDIPTEYIHEPWLMPDLIQSKYGCKIGKDYPFPIIDRKNSRERTLRAYNLSKNYFLSKKDLRRKV